MTEPDPVASALAGWRDAERDATPGPWIRYGIADDEVWAEKPWDHVAETMGNTADAKFIADARTALPALLAAIEAALKAADDWMEDCTPSNAEDEARMWLKEECAEAVREAISRELTGRQDGNT